MDESTTAKSEIRDNTCFGWRNWLRRRPSGSFDYLCCTVAYRARTPFQSASSMTRRCGTSLMTHSDCGFSRVTRFRV